MNIKKFELRSYLFVLIIFISNLLIKHLKNKFIKNLVKNLMKLLNN